MAYSISIATEDQFIHPIIVRLNAFILLFLEIYYSYKHFVKDLFSPSHFLDTILSRYPYFLSSFVSTNIVVDDKGKTSSQFM